MSNVSQPKSVLSLFDLFYQKGSSYLQRTPRKCRQSYRLKHFIYSKRIKPLLKREVNNETLFTLLELYYLLYYYILLYAVGLYTLFLKTGTLHKILTYMNVYICEVAAHIP